MAISFHFLDVVRSLTFFFPVDVFWLFCSCSLSLSEETLEVSWDLQLVTRKPTLSSGLALLTPLWLHDSLGIHLQLMVELILVFCRINSVQVTFLTAAVAHWNLHRVDFDPPYSLRTLDVNAIALQRPALSQRHFFPAFLVNKSLYPH